MAEKTGCCREVILAVKGGGGGRFSGSCRYREVAVSGGSNVFRWNQSHYWKRYPVIVSLPDCGSWMNHRFFLLRGMTGLIIFIALCYQFSTVAPQVLLSFKTKLAEENKTSLSPAMLLVSRNPISSGPSPVELCRKVEMG